MAPTTTERVAAHQLHPGQSIILYGGPVYVTDVVMLPLTGPATEVRVTYRKDFAKGHVIGQTVFPAGVAVELYDDGSPF